MDTRSTKVRRILQLEGRAATLRARYESTLVRVMPAAHTPPSALKPAGEGHAALMERMIDDVVTVERWKCSPLLTTAWSASALT